MAARLDDDSHKLRTAGVLIMCETIIRGWTVLHKRKKRPVKVSTRPVIEVDRNHDHVR